MLKAKREGSTRLEDGEDLPSRADTWASAHKPGSDPWTLNRNAHPLKTAEGRGSGEKGNASILTLKTLEDIEIITKQKLGRENPSGRTEIP